MRHHWNGQDRCEKCELRRTYLHQVDRYVYELPDGSRTLREPPCGSQEEYKVVRYIIEGIVFLVLLAALYVSAKRLNEQREQRNIEEYHSRIPENSNDSI